MTLTRIRLLGLLLFVIHSCEEPVDWELSPSAEKTLVVEAILTDELKQHEIKLTESFQQLNEAPNPITAANVTLSNQLNSTDFILVDPTKGIYRSEVVFKPQFNQLYTMEIELEDEIYVANAELAPVQAIPKLQIGLRLTGERFIARVAESYSMTEQAMYKLHLDWSAIEPSADYTSALMSYYTFSTVDISGLINPALEDIGFPNGTTIIEQKFGLSEDFADYLRGTLIQTSWQGGAFDETENNVTSNFTNGANGYFAICSTISDTILVE